MGKTFSDDSSIHIIKEQNSNSVEISLPNLFLHFNNLSALETKLILVYSVKDANS